MATPVFGVGTNQVIMEPGWEQELNAAMTPFMRDAANEMLDVAKALVPVDTGDLKASLRSDVAVGTKGNPIATVTASAAHAGFVEYGTGRRGKATQNVGAVGRLEKPPSYVHGPSAGMFAQPYLRPALWHILRTRFNL